MANLEPAMETPTKKVWARLSFDQVREKLSSVPSAQDFQCIARPGGSPCTRRVEDSQVSSAVIVLQSCGLDPTKEVVRDIINCLVCDHHSQGPWYRNKVEEAWQSRFGAGFFEGRRSPSEYSRDPDRKTSFMARNSFGLSSGQMMPTPSASESRVPQIRLTPDDADVRHHQRSLSEPRDTATSVLIATNGSTEHARHAGAEETYGIGDGSPLATRSRQSQRRVSSCALESTSAGSDRDKPPSSETSDNCGDLVLEAVVIEDGRNRNPPRHDRCSKRKPELRKFYYGEAHDWAPWTITCGVTRLLAKPLPDSNSKGSIYAARVKLHGDDRSIVKIGYTTGTMGQRLSSITREHGFEFVKGQSYELHDIPYLQLLRLEAIVHADLAYSQRDLLVPSDASQKRGRRAYQTHREYFEVDFEMAKKTIRNWKRRMDSIGLRPGAVFAETFPDHVQNVAQTAVETTVERLREQFDLDDDALWKHCNSLHDRRESAWNLAIPVNLADNNDDLALDLHRMQRLHTFQPLPSPLREYNELHWQARALCATVYFCVGCTIHLSPTLAAWLIIVALPCLELYNTWHALSSWMKQRF